MNIINRFRSSDKIYVRTLIKLLGVGFFMSIVIISFMRVTGAFFSRADVTENTKNLGTIIIESTDISNPFTYTGATTYSIPVNMTNLSDVRVVLRAYVNISWDNFDPLKTVNINLTNSDWTLGEDYYYYYNYIVHPAGEAGDEANFLQSVEFIDAESSNGNTFSVNVYVEALQYVNNAYDIVWTNAPISWKTNLS